MNDDLKTLIELTGGDPEDCNQLLSISKFDLEFALKLLLKAGPKLDPTIKSNIIDWFCKRREEKGFQVTEVTPDEMLKIAKMPGYSITECKEALAISDGDVDIAIEILKTKNDKGGNEDDTDGRHIRGKK